MTTFISLPLDIFRLIGKKAGCELQLLCYRCSYDLNEAHYLVEKYPLGLFEYSNLRVIQYLIQERYISYNWLQSNTYVFTIMCIGGDLQAIKWVVNRMEISSDMICSNRNLAFYNACSGGHLETVKWLISKVGRSRITPKTLNIHNLFKNIAINGHLNVFKWLRNIFPYDKCNHNIVFDFLWEACTNNHLTLAKYIVEGSYCSDNILRMVKMFGEVCMKGYIEMAIWISCDYISINWSSSFLMQSIFHMTCVKGQLEIAKFISTRYALSYKHITHYPIIDTFSACCKKEPPVAKWLFAKFKISENLSEDEKCMVLTNICLSGHTTMFKWLIENLNIDPEYIKTNKDKMARICSLKGQQQLSIWISKNC